MVAQSLLGIKYLYKIKIGHNNMFGNFFKYILEEHLVTSIFVSVASSFLIVYFQKRSHNKQQQKALSSFKNTMKNIMEISSDEINKHEDIIPIEALKKISTDKIVRLNYLIANELSYLKSDNTFNFIRTVEFTKSIVKEQISILDRLDKLGDSVDVKTKKQLFINCQQILLEKYNDKSDLDSYINLKVDEAVSKEDSMKIRKMINIYHDTDVKKHIQKSYTKGS